MFLDYDDLLHPGALAILKAALDNNPDAVAAVGARVDWLCEKDFARRDSHPHFIRKRDIFNDLLFGWSAVSGQNLYKTGIVRTAGGYNNEIPCEDRDLWLRVARLGQVVLCPETVMTYRVHSGQFRPANLLQVREKVARRAIRILPKEKRRNGLMIRRCTRLIDQAEAALKEGRFIYGAWSALRAVATKPGLFTSPLINFWVLRRLGRHVLQRLVMHSRKNKHV
jgi:GT2 family glycosyltransferase